MRYTRLFDERFVQWYAFLRNISLMLLLLFSPFVLSSKHSFFDTLASQQRHFFQCQLYKKCYRLQSKLHIKSKISGGQQFHYELAFFLERLCTMPISMAKLMQPCI